jgi:Protein of unknown function (DUF2917)
MNCEEVRVGLRLDRFHGFADRRQFGVLDHRTNTAEPSAARPTILHANSVPRDAWLAIEDGIETVIQIEHGEVWITEEGSFIDHILVTGQHYAIDRPGVTIISMQCESHVVMHLPAGSMPPRAINLHTPADGKVQRLYRRTVIASVVAFLSVAFAMRPALSPQQRPHSSVQLHQRARTKRGQLIRIIVRGVVRFIKRACAVPAGVL